MLSGHRRSFQGLCCTRGDLVIHKHLTIIAKFFIEKNSINATHLYTLSILYAMLTDSLFYFYKCELIFRIILWGGAAIINSFCNVRFIKEYWKVQDNFGETWFSLVSLCPMGIITIYFWKNDKV